MENVTENNKLIAEFMGGKPHTHYSAEMLIYHSSWDWLMPVVEKIANSGNFCLSEHQSKTFSGKWYTYFVSISNNTFKEVDKPFLEIRSEYENEESKISTYYRFTVEFIKWYNLQNNQI